MVNKMLFVFFYLSFASRNVKRFIVKISLWNRMVRPAVIIYSASMMVNHWNVFLKGHLTLINHYNNAFPIVGDVGRNMPNGTRAAQDVMYLRKARLR